MRHALLTLASEAHEHSIAGPFVCEHCSDARRKTLLGECRGDVDRLIALIWEARHGTALRFCDCCTAVTPC